MASINNGNALLKWVAGGLVSLVLTGLGAYGKYVNDSISAANAYQVRHDLRDLEINQNMEILNTKIDLLLGNSKLRYNGPNYHAIPKP